MKITRARLKEIIREELQKVVAAPGTQTAAEVGFGKDKRQVPRPSDIPAPEKETS